MTSKPNQRYALLDVLSSGESYTMDSLISRVSNRTGRPVKATSLTVLMSRLRNLSGYRIRSKRAGNVWTYWLKGELDCGRAKLESERRSPQPPIVRI